MKTYQGSCHCGAVRFEADIDLGQQTLRCNCSFCTKIRCWATMVAPESFRLTAGEVDLSEYQFEPKIERHFFCKHCGVRPFGIGNSPRHGKFYGVSVACLDNAAIDELANAPITYVDGRNDHWSSPPAQTGHL
ncbi:GFA family protein [Undibacterium sp.]|jgi:hypothetical protein|uniref:GFA family protein n=1 Tax=Undibacterium sp. TaxID=1914977 RepID=UPI002D00DDE5|nr:GFA family protein [Undibacterium sp.]HTD06628.1 GFA family protein [Undibacterium sp.]